MKKLNIVTKKSYEGADGQVKNIWNNVGTLLVFEATATKPEGYGVELHMFPETKFYVFEQDKKSPKEKTEVKENIVDYPTDINPDDIPF